MLQWFVVFGLCTLWLSCRSRGEQVFFCTCHDVNGESPLGQCRSSSVCNGTRGCYTQVDTQHRHLLSRGCADNKAVFQTFDEVDSCASSGPAFKCCFSGNFCSDDLFPSFYQASTAPTTSGDFTPTPFQSGGEQAETSPTVIAIYTALSTVIVVGFLVVFFCLLRQRVKNQANAAIPLTTVVEQPSGNGAGNGVVPGDGQQRPAVESTTTHFGEDPNTVSSDDELYLQGDSLFDSSSGLGRPWLVQRTIGKELSWIEKIGAGKFGEVWRCQYRNKSIAVKSSLSKAESEWKRECQIYESKMFRHNNLLGFIAADVCDNEGVTQMLILTDYHRRGSLHSVLEYEKMTADSFLRLVVTAADGLLHLHSPLYGTSLKPGMAHRDIKSKNILVKDNGEACICDLGLGVIYDPSKVKKTPFEVKRVLVGTRRYMAPEILTGTIDKFSFEKFKAADVYSFSLVLWEVARRCNFNGMNGGAYPYSEPFKELAPDNPTYEEMKDIIIERGLRPSIPVEWNDHPLMKVVARICRTCWKANASSRLTMSRVQKNLMELSVSHDMSEDCEDSGCGGEVWQQQQLQPHGAMTVVPHQEPLTESTRLDLETPEQSGRATAVHAVAPPGQFTENAQLQLNNAVPPVVRSAPTPAEFQKKIPTSRSRSSIMRYGPTDL